MSKQKKTYWNPLIVGAASLFLALFLTEEYYNNYIVNISDNPAGDYKGKAFYIILHFIADHIGKIGLQIIFGVVALVCFYIAYRLYKREK